MTIRPTLCERDATEQLNNKPFDRRSLKLTRDVARKSGVFTAQQQQQQQQQQRAAVRVYSVVVVTVTVTM